MHRSLTLLSAATSSWLLCAQSPIPPPVGTDLNTGVPSDWTIETLSTTGWTWTNTMGYGGSGGLIMDCGACFNYQETTLWSPWLDLSSDPLIDLTFKCAIIGGGVPPPIFVRRDDISGPVYEYRYGSADLIPPPDEVIPSTFDPVPPLDLANVQWVALTYSFYAGLNDDSVRIGLGTGVPLGGWALLDDVAIGDLTTGVVGMETIAPTVLQNDRTMTVRSHRAIQQVELFDLTGRILMQVPGHERHEVDLSLDALDVSIYVLRVWQEGGPVVIKVGP